MDDGTYLPTDVLVYIFERLHPNARRRLRLVCRHWCQVIDTRTATSLCRHAKTLLVTVERVYVVDDLSTEPCSEELNLGRIGYHVGCPVWDTPHVVGTCNGIICLCDSFGFITLYNPVTRETLDVPWIPNLVMRIRMLHRTYHFTYDQATGRYMVVHLPHCHCWVMVFTLGEESWREVSTDGWWCQPDDRVVTIEGTIYWAVTVLGGGVKVISVDLDSKRAPSVIPLPSSRPAGTWCLTKVHGSLGITFSLVSHRMDKTEVWVMERGASAKVKHAKWSHLYTVQVRHTPRHQPQWHDHQHLTSPYFSHGRNHILTWEWLSTGGGCVLYRHTVSSDTKRRGMVEINASNQGTIVTQIRTDYDTFRTFDYVETSEPLSVYKCR